MKRRRPEEASPTTTLVLGTLLAVNPAILFLVTSSLALSLTVPLIALIVVLGLARRFDLRLPTVYALNAVSVVGVFLYAEAIITVVFPDYVIEDLYVLRHGYYFNKPDLTSRLEGKEFQVDYLTNNEGFRIGYSQYTDVTYHFADWLFIGDSFMQAAQVDFEAMFTSLLYRHYPDKVVANVGISGFGLPQELALYEDLGRELSPSVVFLQISPFNDFMNVRESRTGLSDILANRSNFIRFLLQDFKYTNPAELPLGRWTEPFYPTDEENRDLNVFYSGDSEQKSQDLSAFRDYLTRFHDAVGDDGAELVVVLLPTKEQIRPHYLLEVVDAFGLPIEKLDMDRPRRIVREVADSLGLRVIDLWQKFALSPEDPYFQYDEHLSPVGHRLIADTLAAELASFSNHTDVLSEGYAGDRYPVPTSDGSIYYQSPNAGSSELVVADSNLEMPQRLTVTDVDEIHPAVSADGTMLAFTEGAQDQGRTQVVLMDLKTRMRKSLTPGPEQFGAIPAFSPDGRQVAYAAWSLTVDGHLTNPRIAVTDLAEGSTWFVTDAEGEEWRPQYSPGGDRLVYIRRHSGQFDLFVTDLGTGGEEQLTFTPYDEWDPRFSPDGAQVVYSARKEGNWDIFLLDLASGGIRRITATRGDEWDPAFGLGETGPWLYYAGEYGIFRGIYRTPFH